MPQFVTEDGRYLFVEQGDKNAVVYDLHQSPWRPVFDRWSYEAGLGENQPPAPPVEPGPPDEPGAPIVTPVNPEPGRLYQVTRQDSGGFRNRIYSYWSNAFIQDSINAAIVFAGHVDGRPRFYKVDLASGRVDALGQLVNYTGETEGWSFDARGKITLVQGSQLRRVNPFDPADDELLFDISGIRPGCDLWQPHSSENGRVHSATVRRIVSEGRYPYIGTVVAEDGEMQVFDAIGSLDESHVDASGQFLIIEENDDNRVITLSNRDTRWIRDAEGALSHIDCGHGFMVGEDNQRGACMKIDLQTFERRQLFPTWNMGHVSVRGGTILNADQLHVNRVHEGGVTHLLAHGMRGSGYDFQVGANLDPSGRIAMFLSNRDGDQQDIFLVQV